MARRREYASERGDFLLVRLADRSTNPNVVLPRALLISVLRQPCKLAR